VVPDVPTQEAQDPDFERIPRPVVRFGQSYTIGSGETVREIVVISGSVTIEGRVLQDVVVIMGTARLASTAVVEGSLVSVAGATVVEPGARVRRDLVVVAGGFEAPSNFMPGGEHVVIGATRQVRALLPWLTEGLLWGRLIVPSLGWIWIVVGIVFFVYLGLALLFERPVRACADVLSARPLSSFLVGLLVLLLSGPAAFILAISVIGIAVIPFALCALFLAGLFGKIGVLRWLGRGLLHESDPAERAQALRSVVIGFAVLTLVYMVPVLSIIVWAVAGVFGLGAATLAFAAGFRRENPPKPRPVPPTAPVTPPATASATPAGASAASSIPSAPSYAPPPYPASAAASAVPLEAMGGVTAAFDDRGAQEGRVPMDPAPIPPVPPVPPVAAWNPATSAPTTSLAAFPHAAFPDRLAAFALDAFLVVLVTDGMLDLNLFPGRFWIVLLAYHIGFWVWKQTTVGGIICNLRVIRSDGTPVALPEALVRGFSAILSLAALGIGGLWILVDPERQAWHDRIAGTYVVKVPRNWPL
jgi:uncharacterized RDD family membrane protein YckC